MPRMFRRLAVIAAALVTTGLSVAAPAQAGIGPIGTPCYTAPKMCILLENPTTLTTWSSYNVTYSGDWYNIYNMTTRVVVKQCNTGGSCTLYGNEQGWPNGSCYDYFAWIGSPSGSWPAQRVVRISPVITVCR